VDAHFLDAHAGGTVFERSWSLIFGCSEVLSGCSFQMHTRRATLLKRCPIAADHAPMAMQVSAKLTRPSTVQVLALVRGEVSPHGCRHVHALGS